MKTKLQELLDELKGLKRYTNAIDIKGYSHFIEQGNGKIIMKTDLEELIAKYTETHLRVSFTIDFKLRMQLCPEQLANGVYALQSVIETR